MNSVSSVVYAVFSPGLFDSALNVSQCACDPSPALDQQPHELVEPIIPILPKRILKTPIYIISDLVRILRSMGVRPVAVTLRPGLPIRLFCESHPEPQNFTPLESRANQIIRCVHKTHRRRSPSGQLSIQSGTASRSRDPPNIVDDK